MDIHHASRHEGFKIGVKLDVSTATSTDTLQLNVVNQNDIENINKRLT